MFLLATQPTDIELQLLPAPSLAFCTSTAIVWGCFALSKDTVRQQNKYVLVIRPGAFGSFSFLALPAPPPPRPPPRLPRPRPRPVPLPAAAAVVAAAGGGVGSGGVGSATGSGWAWIMMGFPVVVRLATTGAATAAAGGDDSSSAPSDSASFSSCCSLKRTRKKSFQIILPSDVIIAVEHMVPGSLQKLPIRFCFRTERQNAKER